MESVSTVLHITINSNGEHGTIQNQSEGEKKCPKKKKERTIGDGQGRRLMAFAARFEATGNL